MVFNFLNINTKCRTLSNYLTLYRMEENDIILSKDSPNRKDGEIQVKEC